MGNPYGGSRSEPLAVRKFRDRLARAEQIVGTAEFFDAVSGLVAEAERPALAEALAADRVLRARLDAVFAATDREDGLTPLHDEALDLIGRIERQLAAAEYDGDELVAAVATLRTMEDAYGLGAMLPPHGDSRDRYDVALQAFNELRWSWYDEHEVEVRRPRFGQGLS